MMSLIPLSNEPNQRFECMVPVGNETRIFGFSLSYNAVAEYWAMTITDAESDTVLVSAIPLLSGEYPAANLLEQYDYLEIGAAVMVPVGIRGEKAEPNTETLGSEYVLVWSDNL